MNSVVLPRMAIVGAHGIPNRYGVFEQFAEYVSVGLASMGYDVVVYKPTSHPFREAGYKGMKIIRKWRSLDFPLFSGHFYHPVEPQTLLDLLH